MIFSDVVFQGDFFAAALFCGVICGIFYHAFFAVRQIFRCGGVMTFVFDLSFFVLCVITLFAVFFPINCFDIKWYIILAFFGGFCIERFSFNKAVDFAVKRIYNGFARLKRAAAKLKTKRRGERGNDGETASP